MIKKRRTIKAMRARAQIRGRKRGAVNIGKVFRAGGSTMLKASAKLGTRITSSASSKKRERRPRFI